MIMKIANTVLVLVGAAMLLAAQGSLAGSPLDAKTVRVSYADLNVNSSAGTAVLYRRIRRAAEVVCDATDKGDPVYMRVRQQCVRWAIDHAIGQVNLPTLAALHASKASSRG
jgi:UrcA family protein